MFDYVADVSRPVFKPPKPRICKVNKPKFLDLEIHVYFFYISAGPAKTVKGVVGFSAELVCDVEPKVPDDQLQLVLWYKKGHKSPIYT